MGSIWRRKVAICVQVREERVRTAYLPRHIVLLELVKMEALAATILSLPLTINSGHPLG